MLLAETSFIALNRDLRLFLLGSESLCQQKDWRWEFCHVHAKHPGWSLWRPTSGDGWSVFNGKRKGQDSCYGTVMVIFFFTEGQTEIAHNQNLVLSKGLVIWKRWKRMGVLEVKIKSSPQSEKRRTLNVLKFPGDHSRIFMKWTKVYC